MFQWDKKCLYIKREDYEYTTVSLETTTITSEIKPPEGRDVDTIDIPGYYYINIKMNN